MKSHRDIIHLGLKPHRCQKCKKNFAYPSNLKKRTRLVHEEKKPYPCSQCHSAIDRYNLWRKHMDSNYKNTKIKLLFLTKCAKLSKKNKLKHQFICKYCDARFTKQCDLNTHILQHHFKERKKDLFLDNETVSSVIRSMEDEKNFTCVDCGGIFDKEAQCNDVTCLSCEIDSVKE